MSKVHKRSPASTKLIRWRLVGLAVFLCVLPVIVIVSQQRSSQRAETALGSLQQGPEVRDQSPLQSTQILCMFPEMFAGPICCSTPPAGQCDRQSLRQCYTGPCADCPSQDIGATQCCS
jgi:hypothetical protein